MPFIRADAAMFDEIVGEMDPEDLPPGFADQRPSGEFEYESAEAKYDFAELEPPARVMLDALRALGASHFIVHYDGGYDEGFAHAGDVRFANGLMDAREVAEAMAKPPLIAEIRAAAEKLKYSGYYKQLEDSKIVGHTLDDLAHQLASKLLGDGYGTGEYELYGSFTADLNSGEIVDDPNAKPQKG